MKYNVGDVVQTMTFNKADSKQIISNKICIIIGRNDTVLYEVFICGQGNYSAFILEEEILRKLE